MTQHRRDGITVLLPFIGYPRALNALAAVNEIVPTTPAVKHS